MRPDEVPAGWLPVRCLRCGDVLAFPPGLPRSDRRDREAEHHVWLCPNPTPRAAAARRRFRAGG